MNLTLAVFADTHVSPADTAPGRWHSVLEFATSLSRLERAVGHVRSRGPDAIVALGDISNFGDVRSLCRAIETFAASELPVWLVPGNHDCSLRDGALLSAIRLVGCDRVRIPGRAAQLFRGAWIAGVPLEGIRSGESARIDSARLGERAGINTLVVLSHYPALEMERAIRGQGMLFAGDGAGRAELEDRLIQRMGPTIVASGHLHLRGASVKGRVLNLSFGPQIEHPFDLTYVALSSTGDSVGVAMERISLSSAKGWFASHGETFDRWRFAESSWTFEGVR